VQRLGIDQSPPRISAPGRAQSSIAYLPAPSGSRRDSGLSAAPFEPSRTIAKWGAFLTAIIYRAGQLTSCASRVSHMPRLPRRFAEMVMCWSSRWMRVTTVTSPLDRRPQLQLCCPNRDHSSQLLVGSLRTSMDRCSRTSFRLKGRVPLNVPQLRFRIRTKH